MNAWFDLIPLLPEIFLALAGLILVLYAAFRGDAATHRIEVLSIFSLIAALVFVVMMPGDTTVTMNGLFVQDGFARYAKLLILGGTTLAILLSYRYIDCEHIDRPEFPILMLFAALGMMFMVSANHLLTLYVGLELQSLALYVLAAFKRDDAKSSEAGLKYIVLGGLSSGLLLYGISLLYGYTGSMGFEALGAALTPDRITELPVLFGLTFVLAAMAFKISAVPFHMWTPDVYQGSPTPVTAFFAAAPKVAAIALLMRLLAEPFAHLLPAYQQILVFLSAASMVIGALAAIAQTNIKRMLAYSSIGHVGVILLALACGTAEGIEAALIYLAIYFVMSLGTFGIVLCMRRDGVMLENLKDFSGLAKTNPVLGLSLCIFMFSLAGVPPFAGFFGKFYVFMAAVDAGLLWLALLGVAASAISAFYYLRLIKIIYFDDANAPIEPVNDFGLKAGLTVSAAYMLLFCLFPSPVLDSAAFAARSLLGG